MTARPQPVVSIVVPAHDASATIRDTLDSVLEQTSQRWECVVVDDDSSDDTSSIVRAYAARDGRFRSISVAVHSEAAARNAGLEHASAEHVLFLDADDVLAPQTIARVVETFRAEPEVEGVVFGWSILAPDLHVVAHGHWDDHHDHFVTASSHSPFPVHACVLRRELVGRVGGFDPDVSGAADWDLWLRVFRAGARLLRIPDVLAGYRQLPASMSRDARTMLAASLRVIDRAHRPDARVTDPDPRYVNGAPPSGLRAALVRHLCWWGSVAISAGGDPLDLVPQVSEAIARTDPTDPGLRPHVAAFALRRSLVDHGSDVVRAWAERGPVIGAFLDEVERLAGDEGLAWRTMLLLRPPVAAAGPAVPSRLRGVQAVDVELTTSVPLPRAVEGIDGVALVVRLEGDALDLVEVAPGLEPEALRDLLASRFFWDLGCRFLQRRGVVDATTDVDGQWCAFADALWSRNTRRPRVSSPIRGAISLTAGGRLPTVLSLRSFDVRVRVGRTWLDPVRISARDGRVPERLGRAIAAAHNERLFVAVAREVLVGRPVPDEPLPVLLSAAAAS